MNNSFQILSVRLKKFIKSYYRNLLFRGTISTITILGLLFILICTIEYFMYFNNTFRKFLFWTYILTSFFVFIKFIAIPLAQLFRLTNKRISNKDAGKIIGLHFPEIEDKIINILELKDLNKKYDEEVITASIEKKYKKIQNFKFTSAINWKSTFKYLKISLIPFIILFSVFFTDNSNFIYTSTNRIVQYNSDFSPPDPFKFVVEDELKTIEGNDFDLKIKTIGALEPEKVFIKYNNNSIQLNKNNQGAFNYTFKKPRKNISFTLYAEEVSSKLMYLEVLPAPSIIGMEVIITPPLYTKTKPTKIKDLGFIQAPEGSMISWLLSTKNTNKVSFDIYGEKIVSSTEENSLYIERQLNESTKYVINVANEFKEFESPIEYFAEIIKDEPPTISAQEIVDSSNINQRFIKGLIGDDYGFSKLVFSISSNDTTITELVEIDKGVPNQIFFKEINLDSLNLDEQKNINFLFTIYDNDEINGYKQSSTKLFNITKPSKEELIEKYNEDYDLVENGVQEQLASLKNLEEELERIQKSLIENEEIDWNDKLAIKETLKKYNKIKDEVNQLKNKLSQNRENRKNTQNLSESLLKKQEEIEKLIDEIMPEEMKELLEEIEKSLDNLDKSKLQEELQKLQLSNEDIEKELDRNLKLLKQLELEQKLEEAINKLDELSKKEAELANQSKENKISKQELIKQQNENLEQFNKIKKELDKLNSLEKEINKNDQLNTESEQEDIEKTMENSLNQLEKNKKNKASDSQKLSSEKINSLSKKLKEKQKEMSQEKQMEDMSTLAQILENLIYFSKSEESLMLEFSKLYNDDPKYIELMHKQGDLRNDAKVIEDSLFALSQRVPQISATINREINIIEQKTETAINYFRERETNKGTSNQQYVMTSANNLAVLLSSILEQMQKDLASDLPSSQECEKPGNGQPKPGDLQKMQKDLMEHLKNLEKQCKDGKGNSGFSKDLAEMLAKQEQIRMALEEVQKNLDGENQLKLKDTIEKMKENEKDISNKSISEETLFRQEEIETKLLELEKAMREQDESKERESKEGINYEKIQNDTDYQYQIEKEKQIELLKTTPPSLTNYYKQKVSKYFNLLLNRPDL